MSVVQENHWTCDLCGKVVVERVETDAYSDPTVLPPDGWTAYLAIPEEFREHPLMTVGDGCPECAAAPDWKRYRGTVEERGTFSEEVDDDIVRR